MTIIGSDEKPEQYLPWLLTELCEGGDGTILFFVPGGVYVFAGHTRPKIIFEIDELEEYFLPGLTLADRTSLEQANPGDGPLSIEGTRDELYNLVGIKLDELHEAT